MKKYLIMELSLISHPPHQQNNVATTTTTTTTTIDNTMSSSRTAAAAASDDDGLKRWTVVEEFAIPSASLGPQFYDYALQTIRAKCDTCTSTYGLIVNIVKLDDIVDSRISAANCTNYVMIRYTFDAIRPVRTRTYMAKVVAIFEEGMFLMYKCFKIIMTNGTFIPAATAAAAVAVTATATATAATVRGTAAAVAVAAVAANRICSEKYVCRVCKQPFSKTDIVAITITDVDFREDNFYCIGEHRHDDDD